MYCPNCGANNQAEINFCTRCGTNLATVSDALSGKAKSTLQPTEQMPALLRQYHSGRHKMLLGGVSLTAGVALTATLLMAGNLSWLFWVFFWAVLSLFGYGTRNFIKGWHQWSDSSSEMKALGYHSGNSSQLEPQDSNFKAGSSTEFLPGDTEVRPGVTEATTRHLEAKKIE